MSELETEIDKLISSIHRDEMGKSCHDFNNPHFLKILTYGEKAIPVLVNYIRADPDWWAIGAIRRIAETCGNIEINIPKESLGRLGQIAQIYIDWSDEKYPPLACDLFTASQHAQKCGDWHMNSVLNPDPGLNYAWSYFDGSVEAANKYYERAKVLREKALEMNQIYLRELVAASDARMAQRRNNVSSS